MYNSANDLQILNIINKINKFNILYKKFLLDILYFIMDGFLHNFFILSKLKY